MRGFVSQVIALGDLLAAIDRQVVADPRQSLVQLLFSTRPRNRPAEELPVRRLLPVRARHGRRERSCAPARPVGHAVIGHDHQIDSVRETPAPRPQPPGPRFGHRPSRTAAKRFGRLGPKGMADIVGVLEIESDHPRPPLGGQIQPAQQLARPAPRKPSYRRSAASRWAAPRQSRFRNLARRAWLQ